ncbi:MAG: hypothetical protein HOO67_00900 [Candidatus Peribacteraceae bacterium]|nr:hypothetical protein [Candidatus Peribacteraceae bacterium]
MKPLPTLLLSAFLLASCSSAGAITVDDAGEMTGNFSGDVSTVLFIEPSAVKKEFAKFKDTLKAIGRSGKGKRALYEEYVPVIGANGVLGGITELWPKCHSEGHDLGKVIFEKTKDVGVSLRVCRDGCYSGCMHGVLMEAFGGARADVNVDPEQHVDIDLVKSMMDTICKDGTMTAAYSPGDCAHATGHAMMVLADYLVPDAIRYCDGFGDEHMRYYCATGAYMEYVTERDSEDAASGKRALYPCDVGKYPAACARYKMVHVIKRLVQKKSDVAKLLRSCDQLTGKYRTGCYHGAGNGFMSAVYGGALTAMNVCGPATGDERAACIDGLMERMAKYHPDRADDVCDELPLGSADRTMCEAAVGRGMYDMEKDLRLYAL